MNTKILIVEDEAEQAALAADYLCAAGYLTEIIADGDLALRAIKQKAPDVLVLDLMLPGLDGLSLCKAIRQFSDLPIIMTTAKTEEIDRLLGLEIGADDYLCKPYSPRELVARVHAILRRIKRSPNDGLFVIDDMTRTIRIEGRALELTASEYNVLSAMLQRPGVIHSRAQLLELARRDNLDVNDRSIDTHIKNLRRKIAERLPDLDVIHSVYGLGYRVEW